MKNYFPVLLLYVFLLALPGKDVIAQISFGGKPLIETLALPTPPVVELTAPDIKQIKI
jgi:hypothetical protein